MIAPIKDIRTRVTNLRRAMKYRLTEGNNRKWLPERLREHVTVPENHVYHSRKTVEVRSKKVKKKPSLFHFFI